MKSSRSLLVGCFYRPPHTNLDYLNELEMSVTRARNSCKHLWLGGDFNLPGIDWSNNSTSKGCTDKASSDKLLDIAENASLTQMVNSPTRGENTLDLFFTSNKTLVNRVKVIPPLSSFKEEL